MPDTVTQVDVLKRMGPQVAVIGPSLEGMFAGLVLLVSLPSSLGVVVPVYEHCNITPCVVLGRAREAVDQDVGASPSVVGGLILLPPDSRVIVSAVRLRPGREDLWVEDRSKKTGQPDQPEEDEYTEEPNHRNLSL
ncbi:MAG: hypothetical protein M3343_05040 [Actinomycetota bacterium]|nr:hypothetical protein [Actinomycetota bacterium]